MFRVVAHPLPLLAKLRRLRKRIAFAHSATNGARQMVR
ncbi:hypothetical protein BRAS3843_1490018 [Bradyrhizobium sp. STM 3843]|nr:hypothetical protein BRAS3843_1490018 [Bradyrhizobium sp. STM 3843]